MTQSDDRRSTTAGRGQPSSSYRAPGGDVGDLAARLSDLARVLQSKDSVTDTLRGIVRAAVGTVPGAEYAGIIQIEGRRKVHTPASTDELVMRVDRAQYAAGEGPCLDALFREHLVLLPDMTTETRWPKFTARAVDLGVRSMLSFQLYVAEDNVGGLNLYSCAPCAFTAESEEVGLLFAAHAAVALAESQKIERLSHALGTRDLIGQAKGILMERYRITGDQAFTMLVNASQTTNTKLADVAHHLVESGELRHRHSE